MINCHHTDATKQGSLSALIALIRAALSKGKFSSDLEGGVTSILTSLVKSKYAAGANPSQLQQLFDAYLPAAIAGAQRMQNSGGSYPTALFGSNGSGPGLKTSVLLGPAGSGDFFDPTRTATDGTGRKGTAVPSRIGAGSNNSGAVSVPGIEVTPDELRSYFNGGSDYGDSDSFVIAHWIGHGQNPMIQLEALSYAKRLHQDVILPCARYYKKLMYGNPEYPTRLGQILYGIVPETTVRKELRGSQTSRHLLGQAVNFKILGVPDSRVVADIESGAIAARVGTYAVTAGVHASLPFTINGVTVERMLLWQDSGTPGFVGYAFT